jgi:hypothetical protein
MAADMYFPMTACHAKNQTNQISGHTYLTSKTQVNNYWAQIPEAEITQISVSFLGGRDHEQKDAISTGS